MTRTTPAVVYSQDVRFHEVSNRPKLACRNKHAKAMTRIVHSSRFRFLAVNTGGE
jgi:hypothetical protein